MVGGCRCTRLLHRYYHSTNSSSHNGRIVVNLSVDYRPYIYSMVLNDFNIIITFYINTVSNSCYINIYQHCLPAGDMLARVFQRETMRTL